MDFPSNRATSTKSLSKMIRHLESASCSQILSEWSINNVMLLNSVITIATTFLCLGDFLVLIKTPFGEREILPCNYNELLVCREDHVVQVVF